MAWNGGGRGGGRSGGRGGSPSSGRERDDGGGRGGGRGGQGGRGQGRGQGGRGGTPPQSVPRSTPPPAPVTRATPSSTPVWGAPPPASARAAEQQLAEVFEEKATIESVPRSAPSQGQVGKYSMPLAHRGSGGTAGTPVVLLANHFRVKYTPTDDIYRYDVELRGEGGKKLGNANGIPSKPLAEKLMNALIIRLRGQFPQSNVVSDYRKNVYAPIRLPFEGELLVNALDIGERRGVNQEPSLFQAILKPVEPEAVRMEQLTEFMNGRLNYTPQDAIQALDVVLRHLGAQRMTMVGRNFFSGDGATPLGGGAEAWSGYFQSLRPTQNGLIVNLDVSSTAFVRAMPALEFVAEVCATYNNNAIPQSVTPSQYKVVHKTVRGIKVETTHLRGQRRSYRVNGLSPKSASETFFEDENGRRISVVQYFQQHYQRRLQYPNLPCLHVGAMEKKTYLPIEVCHIQAGTKVPRKLTEDQTANMIRVTATRPDVRRQRIDQHVRDAQFVGDSTLGAFGMSVDPKMVQVQGRVLPAPSIVYARNQMEKPRDGVWTSRNKQYFMPQKLVSCAIINTDFKLDDRAIRTFFKELFSEANKLGMGQIATMPPIITQRRGDRIGNLFYQAMQAALDTFKGVKPQIIWMINPRQNADTYGALKIASDTEYGIPSQCMLSKHIMKVNGQYIGNILLKVNTKLGGCNSTLQPSAFPMQIGSKKTIIFGADVTHASPGDTRPSIAALVGSLNKDFTRHASVIRLQGHREEKMVHLSEMVKELMKAFYKDTNGHKPDQIVFFRDGVSEGQFEMVLNEEVTAIRAACASLDKDFKPPITFVIVQKRHHTRFFGTKPNDVDRSGNVRAGTVVDTAVCHPIENDFYLTSHAGLQGTSRPTHYQVLMDEIGLSSDDIQKLTNNLCYTYARCTRSVSLVPSTYYSHLLAFRARFFMSDEFSDTGSSANGYGATPTMPQVHANLLRTMYYI